MNPSSLAERLEDAPEAVKPTLNTTPAYHFAALSPPDVSAICDHFKLPLPTPDVSLDTIADQQALTAAAVYEALRETTSVRLMIAAAALRGGAVRRLAPDPQLAPRPHAKLPHAPPRGERPTSPAVPAKSERVPAAHVLLRVAPNPKKHGTATWRRYAGYRVGLTLQQLIAVPGGVTRGDVLWDLERDFVAFGPLEALMDATQSEIPASPQIERAA